MAMFKINNLSLTNSDSEREQSPLNGLISSSGFYYLATIH